MARYTQSCAPRRLAAGVCMLILSLALVPLAGTWYRVARRAYLVPGDAAVSLDGARQLQANQDLMAAHGVLSVAQTLDGAEQASGYAVIVAVTGYKSVIRLQATFDLTGERLAGVRILSHDETEYLGDRITSAAFTDGFVGRRLPVKLATSAAWGSPVDGLSGSTISADAVVRGVNHAHTFLQAYLAG